MQDELARRGAAEGGAIAAARSRAEAEVAVPSPETGSLLAWAAATSAARHVVEIGSAGGVSGLWLLTGMDERGVLTSIEPDAHAHTLATDAFDEAGVSGRVRSIPGDPGDVLDRLSDAGYELCVLHGDASPRLVQEGLRLLKPGGMMVLRRITAGRDWQTLVVELADDEDLAVAVLPVDDGLALVTVL